MGDAQQQSRLRVLTLATLSASLLFASAAFGALFLTFEPARGSPGTLVSAKTLGQGALTSAPNLKLPVFLLHASIAPDAIGTPADPRLISIGDLNVDAEGNGSLQFRVPAVQSGEYTSMIFCEECAPSSGGRSMLTAGPFQILRGSALPATGSTVPDASVLALVALTLGLGGLVLLAYSRRHASDDRQ
ncbi:MAG: hypothetical protein ACRDKS_17955 [Actinomycetota bacterium]